MNLSNNNHLNFFLFFHIEIFKRIYEDKAE